MTDEEAAGAPRRRADSPLTRHVPAWLAEETIADAGRVAEAEGVAVKASMRQAVERTLRKHRAEDERPGAGDGSSSSPGG